VEKFRGSNAEVATERHALRSRIYEVDVRFSGFLKTKLELASIEIVGRRVCGQIVFAVVLQFNKLISGNWGSSLVGGMGVWKGGKLTSHTPQGTEVLYIVVMRKLEHLRSFPSGQNLEIKTYALDVHVVRDREGLTRNISNHGHA